MAVDENTTQSVAGGAATGAAVGGPWGALIGGGIGLAGSLIGANEAKRSQEAAARARAQAMAILAGVEMPDMEEYLYNYGADAMPEVMGTLSPELEQTFLTDPSAMENVSTDPRLAEAQMDALASLGDIADDGMSSADMMAIEQVRRQTAGQDEAKQGQILQDMAARGQAGSGAELIARLKSSQNAADRSSVASMDIVQEARNRALQALSDKGNLAGNIRSQDFGEQEKIAQAKDVINRFNTQQRSGAESRNVGARNQAQEYNLNRTQNVADERAGLRRDQEHQRVVATGTDYDNRYGRAKDMANIHTGQAAQSDATAVRRAERGAGIGKHIGDMATNYMNQK